MNESKISEDFNQIAIAISLMGGFFVFLLKLINYLNDNLLSQDLQPYAAPLSVDNKLSLHI